MHVACCLSLSVAGCCPDNTAISTINCTSLDVGSGGNRIRDFSGPKLTFPNAFCVFFWLETASSRVVSPLFGGPMYQALFSLLICFLCGAEFKITLC